MLTVAEDRAGDAVEAVEVPKEARRRRRVTRFDLITIGLYLLGACYVTIRMWGYLHDPTRYLPDKMLAEWFVSHGANAVTELDNPLFSEHINAPDGVNMMGNTPLLGMTIPATPLTLLFGARHTMVILVIIGLAGTAAAWYWVLSRHFVSSKMAAAVAGAFAGFSPGMISHAPWHPNLVAQFLIPFIIWRVIKLREEGRWLRNGIVLALLVVYQCFLNEELLFLTALGIALFLLVYLPFRRDELRAQWRPFLAGLGVTAGVSLVLLAYPLWLQFLGPQSYHGLPPGLPKLKLDMLSYTTYPAHSISQRLTPSGIASAADPEGNAFLGWSLVAVSLLIVGWLWRSPAVRGLAVVGVTAALMSFGAYPSLGGRTPDVPGPWLPFTKLPLFRDVIATRLGLVVFPVIVFLLAIATDRILTIAREQPATRRPLRLAWAGVLLAALLPLFPFPVPTIYRPPVPAFIADGTYHNYMRPGETLMAVPLTQFWHIDAMVWQASRRHDFRITGGYFIAPQNGVDGAPADPTFTSPERPTTRLIYAAATSPPAVTDADRQQARADLRHWRVAVVVLQPEYAQTYRSTLEALFGPATPIGGVLIWDTTALIR